jgi:serine/threonine-protein kinase
MQVSPGAVIVGRYLVERKIGAGAMGEVWLGEHIGVGYPVAIKTILAEGLDNPEVVERFKREALLLGRIRSDNVARIFEFVKDPQYGHVLILDFVEGEVFSAALTRKLSVEDAVEIGADIVSGLVDLHEVNVVHRDLKPSNIILEKRRGGKLRAVIVDFGISRVMKKEGELEEMSNLTRAGSMLGTLEYMAPEQMLDPRNVTGGSDLYAMGAMLFRAVAGKHVFGSLNEIELTRAKLLQESPPLPTGRADPIAKRFEEIIARALKKKPADRYQKAEEMLGDLVALRDRIRHPAPAAAPNAPPTRGTPPPLPARASATPPPPAVAAAPPVPVAPPAPPPPMPVAPPPAPLMAASGPASAPPSSLRFGSDSYLPPPPGYSKKALVVAIIAAMVLGLLLGGLLLGGGGAPPAAAP